MNKLYLLLALGLSTDVNCFEGDYANLIGGSSGHFAGDCMNANTLSASYGFVETNCG